MTTGEWFNLSAYLRRIGVDRPTRPSSAALRALHAGHAGRIPFENLDIPLGRPIRLDLESLQAKLVVGRRGGYCFEQNLLLAAALRELGYRVRPLAARVRFRQRRPLARTHMILLVVADDGGPWLADVGFGAEGPIEPVAFRPGIESAQYGRTYRIASELAGWTLRSGLEAPGVDLYSFSLEPQEPADYELANYYVSTHPDSPFRQVLTAQLATPRGRCTLRGREYTVDTPEVVATRRIDDDEEWLDLLATVFGIDPPHGLLVALGP